MYLRVAFDRVNMFQKLGMKWLRNAFSNMAHFGPSPFTFQHLSSHFRVLHCSYTAEKDPRIVFCEFPLCYLLYYSSVIYLSYQARAGRDHCTFS